MHSHAAPAASETRAGGGRNLAGAVAAAALVLAGCITPARQDLTNVGSGQYELEKSHASLVWRVKHMGLSNYTARFVDFDASLDFDPANPAASRLKAVINPASVRAEHPTRDSWDSELANDWFKAGQFPQIVFESSLVEQTGPTTGKVTGELSFLGITKPVTLDVTFNGTANSPFFGARDLLGFSARGVLKRSDFGLTRFASVVGDEVEVIIEAEFVQAAS
ncbi:polyisoprenoid-binding protein [bacterium]|nr:polyisoprenoid-binding protein [bacterium]